MKELTCKAKSVLLLLGLACYLAFLFSNLTTATPGGASITNISTTTYSGTPDSRSDRGGTITTISLSTIAQDSAWKAYVGNISGSLVLRNSGGWSIYQWVLNASTMSANIFVSRNGSVTWATIRCANSTIVDSEQTFFGMLSTGPDTINKTFNYTTHRGMTISSVGTIANNTCPSTATNVNGTAQTVTESAYFQEILLYDTTNLVYGTFVNQDAWGYDNNVSAPVTYDFQFIVAENSSASTGTTYYFYADITG